MSFVGVMLVVALANCAISDSVKYSRHSSTRILQSRGRVVELSAKALSKGLDNDDDDSVIKESPQMLSEEEAFHRVLYTKEAKLTAVTAADGSLIGKILDFTVPFPIVKDPSRENETKTFVRTHYEKMWAIMNDFYVFDACDRFLILGKPGIGKSRFLLFALYQLVMEGKATSILYLKELYYSQRRELSSLTYHYK